MAVTSAEGRQTARLFWAMILPSYNSSLGGRCGNELENGASNMDCAVEFDWVAVDG